MVSYARVYKQGGGYISNHAKKLRISWYNVARVGWDSMSDPSDPAVCQAPIIKEVDVFGSILTTVTDWELY